MTNKSTLDDLFGVKLPIIQAPMAGVQDSELAIAVTRAGGLGSLPCAALAIEQIESQLHTIKSANTTPINLNFFCHQPPTIDPNTEAEWRKLLKPYFVELNIDPDSIQSRPSRESFNHDIIDAIEPYEPKVVSFHFGLPANDLLTRLKDRGVTILSSATTVNEAIWLQEKGADAIIAQGLEAGGHRGMFLSNDLTSQSGTSVLVNRILNTVNLPVISAGGISTPKDVATQLTNGAIAAQVGTAYLLCDETNTTAVHRSAIETSVSPSTTLTNLFSGRPARSIINRVIKELGPINENTPAFPLAATAISSLRAIAEQNGSSDFTPLWCGVNTAGCEPISAYDLTNKLVSQLDMVR